MPVTGASIAGAAKAMSNNNSPTHINSNNNPKSSNNNNNQTSLNFQGAYIVEKIVGHFTNANGVIYYHVKWSGYPLSNKDVGCMSQSNIVSGFDDMLDDYLVVLKRNSYQNNTDNAATGNGTNSSTRNRKRRFDQKMLEAEGSIVKMSFKDRKITKQK
jgi:hypothetical protein